MDLRSGYFVSVSHSNLLANKQLPDKQIADLSSALLWYIQALPHLNAASLKEICSFKENNMSNSHLTVLLFSAILLIGCGRAQHKAQQRALLQMEAIKKHGLVFRLQDYKQRVDYFEKRGMTDRAKIEKSKIDQHNQILVQNFKKEFDFCPIRFYYSSQSNELEKGKPVLLNNNMAPDNSIPLPEKVILANFSYGKIVDNVLEWKSFRVEGTSIVIKPKHTNWRREQPLQAEDVRRINQVLHKMNMPRK